MVACWYPIVSVMLLGTVVDAMEKKVRETFSFSFEQRQLGLSSSVLKPYSRCLEALPATAKPSLRQTVLFCSKGGPVSVSKKVAGCKRSKATKEYICHSKRRRSGAGRPLQYPFVYSELDRYIRECWESGRLTQMEKLYNQFRLIILRCDDQILKEKMTATFVGAERKEYALKFLRRFIKSSGWSSRANSISQSIPTNWKARCMETSAQIRERFRKENVDVILASDEVLPIFYILIVCAIV